MRIQCVFLLLPHRKAKGRIAIMPGAGVNSENVLEIVQTTGVKEIHASAKSLVGQPSEDGLHTPYYETDLEKVKALVAQVSNL